VSAASIEPTATSLAQALSTLNASSTVAAVKAAIANPGSNTTLSLLLVSCVVLVVILLVVFTVLLITPSRRRITRVRRYYVPPEGAVEDAGHLSETIASEESGDHEAAHVPRSRIQRALASSSTIAALVVLAVIGVYGATSTDAYCSDTCHAGTAAVTAAAENNHAACVSCHEAGVLNVVANTASRGRMLARSMIGGSPEEANSAIPSSSCQRCHRGISEDPFTSESTGVMMSHAEVVSGGLPCSRCHARIGHGDDVVTTSMSVCLPCHDDVVASSECSTCHSVDPSALTIAGDSASDGELRLGSGRIAYPAVHAAKRECGGCHDEANDCDSCHGIRMPHSDAFKDGAHARNAAFGLKLECWRCHDPQECDRCHRAPFNPKTGNTTHGDGWRAEHKRAAWDAGCACHEGRGSKRAGSICRLCHAADSSLLPVAR